MLSIAKIQIKVDCSRSKNVISSRGSLVLDNVIPPLHRKLLCILSPYETDKQLLIMKTYKIEKHQWQKEIQTDSQESQNNVQLLKRNQLPLYTFDPI